MLRLRVHVRVLGGPQAEGPRARGRLQLGAQGRGLVVGVRDLLQEAVHLPQGQRVVERLQGPDVGGPVLANWKCDHKFVSKKKRRNNQQTTANRTQTTRELRDQRREDPGLNKCINRGMEDGGGTAHTLLTQQLGQTAVHDMTAVRGHDRHRHAACHEIASLRSRTANDPSVFKITENMIIMIIRKIVSMSQFHVFFYHV